MWRSTYLLSLASNRTIFDLVLSDHRVLFSDVPLGQASFDISSLAADKLIAGWVPLEPIQARKQSDATAKPLQPSSLLNALPADYEASSCVGFIHVNLQMTPVKEAMDPNSVLMMPLDKLRLTLEKLDYYPGETLRGSVILDLPAPIKIYCVKLTFKGETKVSFWNEKMMCTSSQTFFRHTSVLLGEDPSHSKIGIDVDSGTHIWPFEYELPPNLPSNVLGNESWTWYNVEAELLSPWTVNDKRTSARWNIKTCYNPKVQEEKLADSLQDINERRKVPNSNQTVFEIDAPLIAHLRQTVPLEVTIDNTKGIKEIKDALVEWKVMRWYTGKSTLSGAWVRQAKIGALPASPDYLSASLPRVFPILPGAKWHGTVYVSVPNEFAPTITQEHNALYQIFYALKVSLETPGLFNDGIACSFPIVLSHRSDQSTASEVHTVPKAYIHDAETDDEGFNLLPASAGRDALVTPVSTGSSHQFPCPYTPTFYLPTGTADSFPLTAETVTAPPDLQGSKFQGTLLVATAPTELPSIVPSPHHLIMRGASYGVSIPSGEFQKSSPKELPNLLASS